MNQVLAVLLLIGLIGVYFLPAIIAVANKHPHVGGIVALNLLLGWTILGWVAAFIWSIVTPAPPVIYAQQRGDWSAPQGTLPSLLKDTRPCPHCAEEIKRAATVCRFCNRDVPPAAPYMGTATGGSV